MRRPVVLALYGLLVLVWSSTWVAIKIGLEDTPALYGAGLRFTLAGLGLLALTRAMRRPLASDPVLVATLAMLPFAATYGLIYWAEQYIPSGLTAVLFGVMPLYVAALAIVWLRDETVTTRFLGGVGIALGGLVLAFGESLALGHEERAALAALAVLLAPLCSAIGNVAIKRRGGALDPLALNGWAMLAGGVVLLAVSAPQEDWSSADWTGQAVAALLYLAVFGSAVTFVVLTVLLRELPALALSYLPLMIPFGALAWGALLEDETVTALAVAGAALVAAGLAVAQWPTGGSRPSPASARSSGDAAARR